MKVKFMPQNVEFEIQPNQSVMNLALEHGIFIKSVCKGLPSCAECRVRVLEGEYNVIPPLASELALIGTAYFVDRRRLSCQLKCFGDITVDLSEQVEKENGTTKKPKGKYRVDGESQAIRGNMIDEYDAPPMTVVNEPESIRENTANEPQNVTAAGNKVVEADKTDNGRSRQHHHRRRRHRGRSPRPKA